jgi:hypothetical protein
MQVPQPDEEVTATTASIVTIAVLAKGHPLEFESGGIIQNPQQRSTASET